MSGEWWDDAPDTEAGEYDELVEALANPESVVELELFAEDIDELPESIGTLTNLESLVFTSGRLTSLPASLARCPLRVLDVMGNPLTSIPDVVFELTSLETLGLASTGLCQLDERLQGLTQLRRLRLHDNPELVLPAWLGDLKALEGLDLMDCELGSLPDSIEGLTALRELRLERNRLADTPSLAGLQSLETIDLGGNQLTVLPEGLDQIPTLEKVCVEHNPLRHLSADVGCWANLHTLALKKTRLGALPDLGPLVTLSNIGVSNGVGLELSGDLGRLTRLQTLWMSDCGIETLPRSIGDAANLVHLLVPGNRLREIPRSIGRLSKLYELVLSNNPLESLPDELGDAQNLVDLRIAGTELRRLPEPLFRLPNLTALWLNRLALDDWEKTLADIATMPGLRHSLHLNGCGLDARHVDLLGELRGVRSIALKDNAFTEADQERLRDGLPNSHLSF